MSRIIVVEQHGRAPLHIYVESAVDIGRECDGLLLADERISRLHLRVSYSDGQLSATDLGSSNGTLIDGQPLTSAVPLRPDSVLTLGSTTVRVHADAVVAAPTTPAASAAGRGTVIDSDPRVRPNLAVGEADSVRMTSIESVANTVSSEATTLPPQVVGAGDDTVTIMFSDIESSTKLALAMGDTNWMVVLRDHTEIFERRVAEQAGTIIKNQGDGYMVTFASARRSLLCAANVQADLHAYAIANPDRAIRVRMGCHTGEAIRDAGDLYGRHVIIAARVANLADGAQILVSSIVKEITAARGDLSFGEPVEVELKGVEGPSFVHEFDWAAAATATA